MHTSLLPTTVLLLYLVLFAAVVTSFFFSSHPFTASSSSSSRRSTILLPRAFGTAAVKRARACLLPSTSIISMHATSSSSSSSQPPPKQYTNRLVHEKSLYLQQHAHNPVDWWPWGEEAFERAKSLNRPILLSVGYSTCHWCHVMERESFESVRIAQLLNEHFVPIKVDREERPDVDSVYMSFVQAATGGGGWPMTVFLTPDRKPFTGGTYFPEERFAAILEKVHETWTTKRPEVEAQGDRVVETFKSKLLGVSGTATDVLSLQGLSETETEGRLRKEQEEVTNVAFHQLNETYDERYGGFGRSLKFPRPSELTFLLSVYSRHGSQLLRGQRALEMVLGTVQGMKCGGIRDHVGGGFHRYSTDPQWHVPHFEKMVYDNAQLLATYVHAYQVTGEASYATVAHDTARYLLRDMRDPEGGFYSAEDADSPSPTQGGQVKEGAFYVWTREEVHEYLAAGGMTREEEERFCQLFGIVEGGNIKASADPHGELRNQNVLHLEKRLTDVLSNPRDKAVVDKGRAALMAARAHRERPVRDEKVLACWTGLVITGLVKAGRLLHCPEYLAAAEQAAQFVKTRMYDSENKVLRRCAFHGELSAVRGLADDYAFLVRGLLDLYEATAQGSFLEWACELQETMDKLFLCRPGEGRGYLSVSRDDASIAYPVSSTYDGAEPSATSVAVHNLLRLSVLTNHDENVMQQGGEGNQEVPSSFARRAERLLAMALQAPETPYEAPELLSSFGLYGPDLLQVILVGPKDSPVTQALAEVVHNQFLPNAVLLYHLDGARVSQEEHKMVPRMAVKCSQEVNHQATAFVCQNRVCSLPMTDPLALKKRLARAVGEGGKGRMASMEEEEEEGEPPVEGGLSSLLSKLKVPSPKRSGGRGENT